MNLLKRVSLGLLLVLTIGTIVWAQDEKVAVESGATPDYLGVGDDEGALRVDETDGGLTKDDGGNWITLRGLWSAVIVSDVITQIENRIDIDAILKFTVSTRDWAGEFVNLRTGGGGLRGVGESESTHVLFTQPVGLLGESGATEGVGIIAISTYDTALKASTGSSDNDEYSVEALESMKTGDYLDFDETSLPSEPESDIVRVYALTGGLMYARDDDGVGIHKLSNILSIRTADDSIFVGTDDDVILFDSTDGAFGVYLYDSDGNAGRVLRLKEVSDDPTAVYITADLGDYIDGSVNYPLSSQYEVLTIVCDGDNWHVLSIYEAP